MKKLFLIIFLFISGCGTYQQSVQVDDKAYLLLMGDPTGYVVSIDGGQSISLEKDTTSYYLNGKTATKIQVSIGTHNVVVTKDGTITVNRKFYVSTGSSFEVQL